MCGIFGIVTNEKKNLGPILISAGRRLSYRGYDTVGAATIPERGDIDLRKDVGKVDEVASRLKFEELTGNRAILQLRWATFGAPSQINAQPHLDSYGDLVGAHNGNIVNNVELRKQFLQEGMIVRSENDGESCVHAVERYANQGYDMVEAIRHAYNDLEGDYAFVIGKVGEDRLYAIKKGSGLVAGIGDDSTYISSDLPSILPLTKKIFRIQDGEIVIFWADRIELRNVEDGRLIQREPEIVEESMESVQKGGYAHFMLKEIHEQPKVAGDLLHLLDNTKEVDAMVERMANARNLYLVGCGTSYHACLLGSVYLNRLTGKASIPILAPQFIAQYGTTLTSDDVGIFVSQSGETKDVLNAINLAQEKKMGILGIANVVGSTLTQVSEHHIPLACGYEISVPATKTFSNQVIAFLYLAMRMGGHDTKALAKLPEWLTKTLESIQNQIPKIENRVSAWNDLYILGYGLTYPIALEGALKLKEITYAHCEGMLSTEFKHGPLSAVRDGYPVIFVAGPEDTSLIVSGINEITCRGGHAIAIGKADARLQNNANDAIELPQIDAPDNLEPYIDALMSILPLQLLSYRISVSRGYDPDFPRNLSKTLTVD
ncbi:MAG TPA: glutamine--fructose-6-phosphate transaminase (isomerizing) [Anaerolineae bacterium]|nr:glutamine--fructose-6-phosphate transaminase (isomerizing) [Anaerolineae bacterium]